MPVLDRVLAQAGWSHWSEGHTDVPPQKPILELVDGPDLVLTKGGPVPQRIAAALADQQLTVSSATLTYDGVRDPKWRIVGSEKEDLCVIRRERGRVQVFRPLRGWKDHARRLPALSEIATLIGAARWFAADHLQTARNSWRVAEAMTSLDGKSIVIDSSKSALRVKLIASLRPQDVRIIHITRDARAVAASWMRSRRDTPRQAATRWQTENRNLQRVLWTVRAPVCRIRYEDLCAQPDAELRRLCTFLGVAYESHMARLWARETHGIPGNPLIFKEKETAIRLDERWRRELSSDQLAAIDQVAGVLNRKLGYQ